MSFFVLLTEWWPSSSLQKKTKLLLAAKLLARKSGWGCALILLWLADWLAICFYLQQLTLTCKCVYLSIWLDLWALLLLPPSRRHGNIRLCYRYDIYTCVYASISWLSWDEATNYSQSNNVCAWLYTDWFPAQSKRYYTHSPLPLYVTEYVYNSSLSTDRYIPVGKTYVCIDTYNI